MAPVPLTAIGRAWSPLRSTPDCRRPPASARHPAAIAQRAKGEAPAGARNKAIAVDRTRSLAGIKLPQPDEIARTIFPNALAHRQYDWGRAIFAHQLDRQQRIALSSKSLRTARCQFGNDAGRRCRFSTHQAGGLHAQRGGNPVHPPERQLPHPGFQPPDGLRGGGRIARRCKIGERETLGLANIANAVQN
jgi:hypothetical protein